jgi:DNA-directed RNA polymerase subunit RPC12/RpoP
MRGKKPRLCSRCHRRTLSQYDYDDHQIECEGCREKRMWKELEEDYKPPKAPKQ